WPVLIPILDVLNVRARAQLGRDLRTAIHAEIEALECVGWIDRLHVQIGRADSDVRARASCGDRDVGRGGAAGIEEVRNVVRRRYPGLGYSVAPPLNDRPAVHLGTPAAVDVVAYSAALSVLVGEIATGALTVHVLKLGQPERCLEGEILAHLDAHSLRALAGLGRDDDRAVRGACAVQRGCVGTGENADRLDVVRIDVRSRVAEVESAKSTVGAGRVVDRNTIDHEERLVVAGDGVLAADHDAGRSAWRTIIGDLDAGHLARERVDDIGFARRGELTRVYAGLRHTERSLVALNAECGDDDAFERGSSRGEGEVVCVRSRGENYRCGSDLVSDASRRERDGPAGDPVSGDGERVTPVLPRCGPDVHSSDKDAGTRQRRTAHGCHAPGDL